MAITKMRFSRVLGVFFVIAITDFAAEDGVVF
jgi:hypothetical protein